MKLPVFRFYLIGLIILNWSTTAIAQKPSATKLKTLVIPAAVFIVDVGSIDDTMSSQRSVDSIETHFAQVNRVWSQAGIKIDPVAVQRIDVPRELLRGLIRERGRGGIARFFSAMRRGEIDIGEINNNALIWTFYVRDLGGPNGLKPVGANSIFVVDNPSNEDYRVTSHEIGHVLGLYHVRDNVNQLLFPGSNGLILSDVEQTVARYVAQRILE